MDDETVTEEPWVPTEGPVVPAATPLELRRSEGREEVVPEPYDQYIDA